ncbi:MAG: hypothetical protein HY291_05050 [Planctomycetes bacterium]|nr:hypothetical protein [Planctomycetota bacterium]
MTDTFGNSKVETRTYRGDNRTSTIAIPTGITNFAYSWDVNKNKTQENDAALPTNVQDYTYDNEDRLTGFARNSGQTQAWTLSLVGDWSAFNDNGSSQTRTHNSVHELTAINSTSLAYDLKGNLTTNSNGQTHTWDFENCMKTAVVGADTATYQYDAFRRRVKKSFQGNSTIFAYDGWRSIAEYDGGASPSSASRLFVFGTYLDEPLMMLVGSTKYYYHSNDLYSVAALTNSAGTVVERYKYDPYGKVTVLDASGTAKSDPNNSEYGNPFLFQGQRVDKETGLGQWRYRYYDYSLGRFLNRNPWGYIHSFPHLYDFVSDRPTDWLEPLSGGWREAPAKWPPDPGPVPGPPTPAGPPGTYATISGATGSIYIFPMSSSEVKRRNDADAIKLNPIIQLSFMIVNETHPPKGKQYIDAPWIYLLPFSRDYSGESAIRIDEIKKFADASKKQADEEKASAEKKDESCWICCYYRSREVLVQYYPKYLEEAPYTVLSRETHRKSEGCPQESAKEPSPYKRREVWAEGENNQKKLDSFIRGSRAFLFSQPGKCKTEGIYWDESEQ